MNYSPVSYVVAEPHLQSDRTIGLDELWGILRRQALVFSLAALVALGLAVLYLKSTPRAYLSFSQILIDDGIGKPVDEVSPLAATLQTDATIMSQIEIIRSTRLARAVAEKEKLDEDIGFLMPPRSGLSRLLGFTFGSISRVAAIFTGSSAPRPVNATPPDAAAMKAARLDLATNILRGNLLVDRSGRSNVIVIGYRSHDPALAQRIAKAYSDAFLADQLEANYDATERATVWLQQRLTTLQTASQAAALAAEEFRAQQGLSAARGELISEQRLSEINAQLIIAQSETAGALARYEQFERIVGQGADAAAASLAISTDGAVNEATARLRTSYLDLRRREQEVVQQYGPDHPQAIAMRGELSDMAGRLFEEAKQLAGGYRSEYDVKLSREQALRASVEQATGQNASAQRAQVQLKDLQQKSDALNNLYQTFLARYEQVAQQRTFPIAKARVISDATLPERPSSPRSLPTLAACLLLGLLAGGAIGAMNEFNERFFRTADDVRNRLGAKFLGHLPAMPVVSAGPGKRRRFSLARLRQLVGEWMSRLMGRVAPKLDNLGAATPDRAREWLQKFAQRSSAGSDEMSRAELASFVVDAPNSMYAESLRNVRLAAEVVLQGKTSRVIGVLSVLPGEGKSTVASNLAALLTSSNLKTLLIDGDLRNPQLTRNLKCGRRKGLIEAVTEKLPWNEVAVLQRRSRVAFVPAFNPRHLPHTGELLSSAGMKEFLDKAKETFDYIIIDLPPLGPVTDAKAFAPLADAFVWVTEWGKTPRVLVRSALESEPEISTKTLGVLLNKVDVDVLPRFSVMGSGENFLGRYASYTNYYVNVPSKPEKVRR